MKKRNLFGLLILCILLIGCVSKERESELLERISQLEQRLDECQNGAERLHSKLEIAFQEEEFNQVKSLFSEIKKRHPESEYFASAESIHQKVLNIEEERRERARIEAEKEKERRLAALKKLQKNFDDVSRITWYKNPYFTHYNNTNRTSIYIGKRGEYPWLRLKMSYQGDGWIFFERAYLSYEGRTKEISFDEYDDKETENEGGGVWEWIDVSVPDDLIPFLYQFAESSEAKMRLSGKYTRTRKLTWEERQGILDVLNGYRALENE